MTSDAGLLVDRELDDALVLNRPWKARPSGEYRLSSIISRLSRIGTVVLATLLLVACARHMAGSQPYFVGERITTRLDASRSCLVSADGLVWYRIWPGAFPPIDLAYLNCPAGGRLGFASEIPNARWARTPAKTRTSFVAATLQDDYSRAGSEVMEQLARANGIPITWMVGNRFSWRANRDIYLRGRAAGDDIEIEPYDDLLALVRTSLPTFIPAVSIEGAGHERYLRAAIRRRSRAFWGIAWNSSGVDKTFDAGAPWGVYCADQESYKRPARDGRCDLVGIEWTARDLTRAFWTEREDAYSTDPDDLQYRADLTPDEAARYMQRMVDAYAAAGEFRPLLMIAQQESGEMGDAPGSREILAALYAQVRKDQMHVTTLRGLLQERAMIAHLPRAVAFPYVPTYASFRRTFEPPEPATIDYVDEHVALTFVAGRTLPVRAFDYDRETRSRFDQPVPERNAFDQPLLVNAAQRPGQLVLSIVSPKAQHYAVAIWSDVDALGPTTPTGVRAGRAGFAIPINLRKGTNDITLTWRTRIDLSLSI